MARRSSTTPQAQALDDALRRLFRSLEARAVPDSLKAVLDQLQAQELEGAGAGR
jgi:hypothetical protein